MNTSVIVFTDTNSSLGRNSSILKVRHRPEEQPTSPQKTAKVTFYVLKVLSEHSHSTCALSCILDVSQ